MTFDISQYKLKHIVSIRPYLIKDMLIAFDIKGTTYNFKVKESGSELVEFEQFFKHRDIRSLAGPIENEINNITHGKSKNQMSKKHQHYVYNSKFKLPIEGNDYEFEITGIGPAAVKLGLFLKFNNIETSDVSFEKKFKQEILDIYSKIIEDNENYQAKLNQLKKEYDAQQAKQAAIEEQVRKEEEEKARKRRELEEFLSRNKPEKPFKY